MARKLVMLVCYYNYPTVCICGENLGNWPGGTSQFINRHGDGRGWVHYTFMDFKREHFKARHPRRLAMGLIC